jgi:hypothetical protein
MLVVFEEHFDEVTLKSSTRQIRSIKIDAPMNSVHITLHYVDMTSDTASVSSEILSLRLCKSAKRVRNTLLLK